MLKNVFKLKGAYALSRFGFSIHAATSHGALWAIYNPVKKH